MGGRRKEKTTEKPEEIREKPENPENPEKLIATKVKVLEQETLRRWRRN
jgi:hypothetical protein